MQHARMLVVGYPFTPDVLAITNLVRALAARELNPRVCGVCAARAHAGRGLPLHPRRGWVSSGTGLQDRI